MHLIAEFKLKSAVNSFAICHVSNGTSGIAAFDAFFFRTDEFPILMASKCNKNPSFRLHTPSLLIARFYRSLTRSRRYFSIKITRKNIENKT